MSFLTLETYFCYGKMLRSQTNVEYIGDKAMMVSMNVSIRKQFWI